MSVLFQPQVDGAGHIEWTPPIAPPPPDELPADEIEETPDDFINVEAGPDDGTITLRPYQVQATKRIEEELYGLAGNADVPAIEPHDSTLLVMATGLGKTVVFAQVIKQRRPGKVLIIAHRSELIYQAKATMEALWRSV